MVERRQTQPERVETSRERLLDAAAELFLEGGYRSTSASEIADRAGYSREMVRVRFGSKLGLASELVRIDYQQAIFVERDLGVSGLDMLRRRADQLAIIGRSTSVRVRAAFVLGFESAISVPELDEWFAPWLLETEARFVEDIEQAVADGSVRHLDPKRIGRLLMAAATGGAYHALRSGEAADAATAFREVLELIESTNSS